MLPELDEDTAAEAVLPGGAQTSDDAQPSDDDALDDARSDDPEENSEERPVGTYLPSWRQSFRDALHGQSCKERSPGEWSSPQIFQCLLTAVHIYQGLVSQNLRTVIGGPGTIYPDFGVQRINPTTQERFLDPAFEETVAHPTNSILIAEVVRQVEANLARVSLFN
jgi:hypothetical protein